MTEEELLNMVKTMIISVPYADEKRAIEAATAIISLVRDNDAATTV